jgi:polypeptide N-acetylgalactosaminyltransferase
LYLKHLPHVSIVVIFHNEHASLIKRTLHSIINRTPAELLDEIILVNDASTKEELDEPLEIYVAQQFRGKVKVVKMKERVELIVARMEGAKVASSEVLVFLDSHIEVNVNWLPPLLGKIKHTSLDSLRSKLNF